MHLPDSHRVSLSQRLVAWKSSLPTVRPFFLLQFRPLGFQLCAVLLALLQLEIQHFDNTMHEETQESGVIDGYCRKPWNIQNVDGQCKNNIGNAEDGQCTKPLKKNPALVSSVAKSLSVFSILGWAGHQIMERPVISDGHCTKALKIIVFTADPQNPNVLEII